LGKSDLGRQKGLREESAQQAQIPWFRGIAENARQKERAKPKEPEVAEFVNLTYESVRADDSPGAESLAIQMREKRR